VISIYDKLSRYEAIENGLVVAYGSMYGHTEQLAEIIGAGAADAGLKNIVLHNVSINIRFRDTRDIFK
jgi:flavorubredoxin